MCCDADLTTVEPIRHMERLRRVLPALPDHPLRLGFAVELGGGRLPAGRQPYLEQARAGAPAQLAAGAVCLATAAPPEAAAAEPARPRPEVRPRAGPEPDARPARSRRCAIIPPSSATPFAPKRCCKEFLLLLREIIGVNRAAIFLRQPPRAAGDTLPRRHGAGGLHSACAIGLAPGLLEHLELSLETGIGGYLFPLRPPLAPGQRGGGKRDPQMRREFDLLGAQVAIPVLDRETLVGVAVFDGRVTGEPVSNEELALIFHLLEHLGLAVKNIWLHDKVAARPRNDV